MKRLLVLICCLAMLACEEEEIADDFGYEAAEIIGLDASLWVCGGGWYIATATDTMVVHQINNQQVMDSLEQQQEGYLIWETGLKVWVVFEEAPASSCAVNYPDRIKELKDIQLRED